MKIINYLFIVSLFFVFACGNKSSNKNNSNNDTILKDSTKIAEEITVQDVVENDYSFEKSFPELTKILASDKNMLLTIKQYADNIFGEINSEAKVLEILDMRTQILKDDSFYEILDNYYYSEEENDNFFDSWENIYRELNLIGFQVVAAEGQFVDIDIHVFLEKEIDTYLKEEDRLFIKLQNVYSNSKGGEYPYSNLELYSKVVEVGEELMAKYPNHKNKQEIERIVYVTLFPFVDYHEITGGDYKKYCVGGLTTESWPFETSIEFHDEFLENYKNSKFFDVIQKIRENYSVIELDENSLAKPLYVVVTDEFETEGDANSKVWEYLNKGIDIPHSLFFMNADAEQIYAVAYRFYPNKALASEALNVISKINKNAKIIYVNGNGEIIE